MSEHSIKNAKSTYQCIAEMVAALECDYDRLEALQDQEEMDDDERQELEDLKAAAGECQDRDDAEQRIQEDPLEIAVRSDWYAPGSAGEDISPTEYLILLSTGGPACRIIGDLGQHGQPESATLQHQDWYEGWQDYTDEVDESILLTYAQQFYFGD